MGILDHLVVREQEEPAPATAAERRAARLAYPDLYPWANQCLSSAGRELDAWHRDGDAIYHLDESVQAAEALVAVLKEIRERAVSGRTF